MMPWGNSGSDSKQVEGGWREVGEKDTEESGYGMTFIAIVKIFVWEMEKF